MTHLMRASAPAARRVRAVAIAAIKVTAHMCSMGRGRRSRKLK